MKTQKVCECQDTNFNKNALVLFSSNYINWILTATHLRKLYFQQTNKILMHNIVKSCVFNFIIFVLLFIRIFLEYFNHAKTFNVHYFISYNFFAIFNDSNSWFFEQRRWLNILEIWHDIHCYFWKFIQICIVQLTKTRCFMK